jgi:preprotein translocase SecE subunit
MENERNRWVNAAFLAVSFLVYFLTSKLTEFFVVKFDLEARIPNAEALAVGLSVALGLGLFIYLLKNQKSRVFMDEVVLELSRVTWPTQRDTSKATIVVVIMVLIAGFVVGALDGFWHWALKFII